MEDVLYMCTKSEIIIMIYQKGLVNYLISRKPENELVSV